MSFLPISKSHKPHLRTVVREPGAETHPKSHRMSSQMEVEVTSIMGCHCAVLYFINVPLRTGGSKKEETAAAPLLSAENSESSPEFKHESLACAVTRTLLFELK